MRHFKINTKRTKQYRKHVQIISISNAFGDFAELLLNEIHLGWMWIRWNTKPIPNQTDSCHIIFAVDLYLKQNGIVTINKQKNNEQNLTYFVQLIFLEGPIENGTQYEWKHSTLLLVWWHENKRNSNHNLLSMYLYYYMKTLMKTVRVSCTSFYYSFVTKSIISKFRRIQLTIMCSVPWPMDWIASYTKLSVEI